MKDKIKKIVIGIRYRRSFRVPNIVGEIVDQVLHDDDSPFKSNFLMKLAKWELGDKF